MTDPANPWELIVDWLPANSDPLRPTMSVATVDEDGGPDARIQLLSEFDELGFFLHTDSRSRKVRQLAANPRVALDLHIPEALHQLVVRGLAEVATPDEQAGAFRARSPYLQQLAWQNTDEFASLPYPDRVASWASFAAEHPEGYGQPPTWIGYRVRPMRLTFWHGSPDTASRRVEYTRVGEFATAADLGPIGDAQWTVTVRAG